MKTPTLAPKLAPCLWFDSQAEEAARFYVSIFPSSRIVTLSHYLEGSEHVAGKKTGTVMTVSFDLGEQRFTALNGGPAFTFNESVSLQIECDTQAEIDYYWNRLSDGGDPRAQQCGWLKDKYGLSWQVLPAILPRLLVDPDVIKAQRTMQAMLQMKKLDIAALQRAFVE